MIMLKKGYLLVDLLISILIGTIALIAITELVISMALFTKIIIKRVNSFMDSTFAVDFVHFEIRKRYVCCWRTESTGSYEYFGYVGLVDGKEKLIVYRGSSDEDHSTLMRCSSNNLNSQLTKALCNNLIYKGEENVSLIVEDGKLKVVVGKHKRVINLGGIGYGL